jgi:mono/diheme cytochrome c family protein
VRRVLLSAAAAWAIAAAAASDSVHTAGPGQGSPPAQTPISNAASAGALVARYCAGCHNDRLKTGGLSLDASELDRIGAHAETWEKVVQKLRAGVMPPAGAPRPDPAAYESLTAWIEGALDKAAAAHPNPGRRPAVHRLNRTEYRNAIRDLLDLEIDVASLLPADDSSYGFDNIGDILSISPTLLEAYLEAARRISQEALGSPSLPRDTVTYRVSPDLTQDYRLDGLPFGTRGGMLVEHHFPLDGEYIVKAQLLRSFIGGIMGLSEVHQLEFSLDGHRMQLFPVGGKKPAAGEGDTAQPARSSERPADADLEVKFTVKAGTHRIGVAFLERPSVQGEDLRPPYLRSYAVLSDFATGQPHVASVAITGPVNGTPGDTPSRRRVFVCRPDERSDVRLKPDTAKERACARQILAKLARGAYRRPVNGDDLEPLLRFYDEGRSDGTFDAGIERALRRLLVSPEFLARIERDPSSAAPRQQLSGDRSGARVPSVVLPVEQHSGRAVAAGR